VPYAPAFQDDAALPTGVTFPHQQEQQPQQQVVGTLVVLGTQVPALAVPALLLPADESAGMTAAMHMVVVLAACSAWRSLAPPPGLPPAGANVAAWNMVNSLVLAARSAGAGAPGAGAPAAGAPAAGAAAAAGQPPAPYQYIFNGLGALLAEARVLALLEVRIYEELSVAWTAAHGQRPLTSHTRTRTQTHTCCHAPI
jgi:hypothetical protein